jgi:hypothetical protein
MNADIHFPTAEQVEEIVAANPEELRQRLRVHFAAHRALLELLSATPGVNTVEDIAEVLLSCYLGLSSTNSHEGALMAQQRADKLFRASMFMADQANGLRQREAAQAAANPAHLPTAGGVH